jgi:D-galactarolactone isomerase
MPRDDDPSGACGMKEASAMTNDRPRLKTTAGATDTHIHFYDTAERYPVAPTATFLPPPARVADYRRVQQRLGLERVVVVQPSAYGTDNRCTMDAVAELGAAARAVVVVDRSVIDAELERLTAVGARGIRFHMLRGGVLPWDILEEMAARVDPFGWHVQLQCNGRELPEREAMLRRLPGDLVIDHVGRFMDPVPLDHPAFACLLGLLETGRDLGQAVRTVRELAVRAGRVRGRERARHGPRACRARAHAVGVQLAAPGSERPR